MNGINNKPGGKPKQNHNNNIHRHHHRGNGNLSSRKSMPGGEQKQSIELRRLSASGSTAAAHARALKRPIDAVPGDEPWQETGVVRTLWPPQPGTLRWRALFGDNLVCVRYRHDTKSLHRYTTMEILVDHAPVRAMRGGRKLWQLKTSPHPIDQRKRRELRLAGAEWDPPTQAWRLSMTMARQLGLTGQIERVTTSADKKPKARKKEAKAGRN